MIKPFTSQLAPLLAPETLGARAANVLRDAIAHGNIEAGVTLRLDDLARQFGISRIPLRDALRQLEKEGFVAVTPYRGTQVLSPSRTEARQISEASELLHGAALRHVFPKLTPAVIDQAAELLRQRSQSADTAEWLKYSDEFLKVFYGPAHIPYLVGMIKLVTDQSLRYLYLFLPVVRAGHVPKTTFADVLSACRRGDLDGALHSLKETHRSSSEILDIALR